MLRGNRKAWLMTVALVVVPFAGVFLLLYGIGLLVARKRRAAAPDPYEEWLTFRDRGRWQGADAEAPRRSASRM